MEAIHVKFYLYNGKGCLKEIRRLNVPRENSWEALVAVVKMLAPCWTEFAVEYKDPENDSIAMSSQQEWEECLRLGEFYGNVHQPLRLHVKKTAKSSKREGRCSKERCSAPQPMTWEPHRFYTSDASPIVHNATRLQEIQSSVPFIIRRYFPEGCDPSSTTTPTWLSSVVTINSEHGNIDMDVNVDELAVQLSRRAMQLMDEKNYTEAMQLFQDAHVIKPTCEKSYNIACCHACMGQSAEAIDALNKAVEQGYSNLHHMLTDPDLSSLHGLEGFQALAGRLTPTSTPSSTPSSTKVKEEEVTIAAAPLVRSAVASLAQLVRRVEAATRASAPVAASAPPAPEVVEPAVPAVEVVEVVETPEAEHLYNDQLTRLMEMGFGPREYVLRTLEEVHGVTNAALEKLLSAM